MVDDARATLLGKMSAWIALHKAYESVSSEDRALLRVLQRQAESDLSKALIDLALAEHQDVTEDFKRAWKVLGDEH